MIIPTWVKSEIPTDGYELYMRSTITDRGVQIRPPRIDEQLHEPNQEVDITDNGVAEIEYSSRRYSVIKVYPGVPIRFMLEVGSVSYDTPFDSEDPQEPFRKYINGEFKVQMYAPVSDTAKMTSIDQWSGSPQDLIRYPWE